MFLKRLMPFWARGQNYKEAEKPKTNQRKWELEVTPADWITQFRFYGDSMLTSLDAISKNQRKDEKARQSAAQVKAEVFDYLDEVLRDRPDHLPQRHRELHDARDARSEGQDVRAVTHTIHLAHMGRVHSIIWTR
jgi:hypothetical protein